MRFRVTLNHNNASVGDVFYTVPTTDEMKKAEKIIIDLCNERLTEAYKANAQEEPKTIEDCLNNEIEKMCSTEIAYNFLILKEIAEVSQEAGYPIKTLGNLSGSIISYLLGITEYDPLNIGVENYLPELTWGTNTNISIPTFENIYTITPHFKGVTNIIFEGTLDEYYLNGPFVDLYISGSQLENTHILCVRCKDGQLTYNKWGFNV